MTTAELVDIGWILGSAALVMLMQAGFSSLESGLVRSKNSINVAAKNFADFCLTAGIFWFFAFGIMFGDSVGGLLGASFFVFNDTSDAFLLAFFIFQVGFAGTATTIVSGAVAERMRFAGYLAIAGVVSAVLYPTLGHWVWASLSGASEGGWLENLGFIDFAGSTVVHSVGGWMALAAVMVIGPRIGRFGENRVPIHGHDLPLVTVGVFILWFGWFGFNGGSLLGLTPDVPRVLVNTTVSGALGGLAALGLSWWRHDLPDVPTLMNGSLAGLVGITASANIVSIAGAVVIGAIAGLVMFAVTELLERFEIDDAVGAVPVHLGAGVWGTLAVALFGDISAFADGATRLEQFGIQTLGVLVAFVWTFGVGYIALRLIDRVIPLRIDPEGERIGLNVAEHGASTEILDLLTEMDAQRVASDFTTRVTVEPHTEVGQIAQQYNRVLSDINAESERRQAASAALRLLQRTAVAANESETIDDAMQQSVDEVRAHTGWPVGHVYLLDEAGSGSLVSTSIWSLESPDAFTQFRGITDSLTFGPGEGLPGRVLDEKATAVVQVEDGSLSPPRAAAAVAAGLNTGLAVPVTVGSDVVAVLEFFTIDGIDPDGDTTELIASVGTQLGRAVERRRSDEARLRSVVDNMPALILLRDLSGRFLVVNDEYEKFYGFNTIQLRGRTLPEVETTSGVFLAAGWNVEHDRDVLRTGRAIERELTATRSDGTERIMASVRFPVADAAGDTVAIGGIELDITERKDHEKELAELLTKVEVARDTALRATQAKSQFLANMSHELRTPLNAILGFSRLVRRRSSEGALVRRDQENLEKIVVSAEHLMSLINDILDLSRIEAGRMAVYPRTVDLEALSWASMAAVEPSAVDKGLDVSVEITPAIGSIFTDEEKLRQILINLLGNAVKFTEYGRVSLRIGGEGGQVTFSVTDTGVGIPEDSLAEIFEEFQQVDSGATRRYRGTGLGLSISRRLARLLGGSIEVASSVGAGSTFTVTIPRRYVPPLDDEAAA